MEEEIASERRDTATGEVSFRKRSRKPRTLGSMLDCSLALGRSDIIQVPGGRGGQGRVGLGMGGTG